MEKDIFSLKLHESTTLDSEPFTMVQRVPGGWNYIYGSTSVHVPFNNEFQEKKPKKLFPPEEKPKFSFKKSLIELGVEKQIASDWLKVREKKKAANTETAFNAIKTQIQLTTDKANDCIKKAVEKSWSGFKAEWYFNETKKNKENEQESLNEW